jgi:hypothetical protein
MQDLEKLDQDKQRLLMEGVAPRAISGFLSSSSAEPEPRAEEPKSGIAAPAPSPFYLSKT